MTGVYHDVITPVKLHRLGNKYLQLQLNYKDYSVASRDLERFAH